MWLSVSLRRPIDFLPVIYIKDKQKLLFNFIFDLLWTGWNSSVSSAAFLGLCELKQSEKHGFRQWENSCNSDGTQIFLLVTIFILAMVPTQPLI
jgi:hypothetical protein